jgi:hypothetical protein
MYYYYYYGCTALCWALAAYFTFLTIYTVGRTPWTGISPLRGRYLNIEQHKQNKCTQYKHPCLKWDSNPRSQLSSERALDRAATVIGIISCICLFSYSACLHDITWNISVSVPRGFDTGRLRYRPWDMRSDMRGDDRPNYKRTSIIEMKLNTRR